MSQEKLEILNHESKSFVPITQYQYWHEKALSLLINDQNGDTKQAEQKQETKTLDNKNQENVSNLWNLYTYDSMIGSGASCHVMSGFRKTDNKKVAIKEIKSYKNLNMRNRELINLEQFENEYNALLTLSNSRLLNMLDAYKDTNHYYIVSEYLQGTTLTQMIIDNQSDSNVCVMCIFDYF